MKLFLAELKRSFSSKKVIWIILTVVMLMWISSVRELQFYFAAGKEYWGGIGGVDLLENQMMFDSFKIVIAIAVASLYTSSFCRDLKSQYLRHILCRTDIYTYALVRFAVNLIIILFVTIVSDYVFVLGIACMGFPLVSAGAEGGLLNASYYIGIIREFPLAYIGIVGLQFGMVIAVFSSIGLLYSAYQPNAFVSIGIAALSFYIMMSQSFLCVTPFDFLNLTGMNAVLPWGTDTPYILSICWGVAFPLFLIVVCCQLFYRKLKRREADGSL